MAAPITWAEATSPILWSNIGIDWDTPAVTGSSTFALSNTFPSSGVGTLVAFSTIGANMGKIHASTLAASGVISFGNNMGYPSEGGFTFSGEVTFSNDLGYTQSGTLTNAVGAVTFALDNTYVNNTNHQESVSLALNTTFTDSSEFLWNEVSDVPTTWTDVEYPN